MKDNTNTPPAPGRDKLDELAERMLALGGFAEGTQQMTGSEIKSLLLPFFGQERIEKAVDVICGRTTPAPAPEFVGLPFRVGTKWLTVRIPKSQFDAAMADAVEPIGLPVWNGIGQPGEVMLIDKLPPAERPTPITDFYARYPDRPQEAWRGFAADLERQLAEAREQRDRLAEALDTLTLVVGLTPIAGNKDALQEAMDAALAALAAVKETNPNTQPPTP